MMSDPQAGGPPTGVGIVDAVPGAMPAGSRGESSGRLLLGTWNLSGWSAAKARTVFDEVGADVLAVQETHLAALPLHWAHGTMRAVGRHLLHGHPVPAVSGGTYGKSSGVGFVLKSGVAASAALPVGAAWRWLHHVGRLHGIKLAPRPGLPRGLLLLSVYAPLQTRQQEVIRCKFSEALLAVTHVLDMQVPTLLMGDFNGSVLPGRDFQGTTSSRRAACSLLSRLLGPSGAWVDVQAALLPEPLPWTFQLLDRDGNVSASRIDLLLANHAAMALVRSTRVLVDIRDGGHSPVLVELSLSGPATIDWRKPPAQLPTLLQQSSQELQSSPVWSDLLARWCSTSVVRSALDLSQPHTASTLSKALSAALQHLVSLAGGWASRPAVRRLAYDSAVVRRARRNLAALYHLERLSRAEVVAPGCWPRACEQLCDFLHRRGLSLPRTSLVELRSAVLLAIKQVRTEVDQVNRSMRQTRYTRWRDALPRLWHDRPGVVFHWLQAPSAAWGCTPIVDDTGQQCLTVESVDRAVRHYWVDQVLCQHQNVDSASQWRQFTESEFYPFVPVLTWHHAPWTGAAVAGALRSMSERSSPGLPHIPIAVWKALPAAWMEAIARMLNLIEAEGVWPQEWLDAYIVMIPKASGGSRPRDQRPITVLPVVYRLWAKGVTLEWQPVMQQAYLGQAAMGFRAQAGTMHVAQLLSDIMALCRSRGSELWLISFDIEKCYDSVPWWALFGMMRRTGIADAVVRCFEAYYQHLRRRFCYGQVDGSVWHASNSLMQGCPASPDELNLLLEPFHRWALAAGLGVNVDVGRVPSVSFADDVALVASTRAEAETLIAAYLRWCSLLQLKVTKAQIWSNTGPDQDVTVGSLQMRTVPTFKIVGVVLGLDEHLATELHAAPRLSKALLTLQRLRALELPASIAALLWRTAVLPQALYGCEVRDVKPVQLVPLASGVKAALGPKFPLMVNAWRAPEVLVGPPLGDSMVQDPTFAMRDRQLCWWQVVANLPTLVGAVHRLVAWQDGEWLEPTPALAAALRAAGWRAQRNAACLRAQAWPAVESERSYPGEVLLQPVDAFALPGAVYTDGSVAQAGGAAAVHEHEEQVRTARVPAPRSSTQCELVALVLAMALSPPHVLSDSLAALTLLQSWGRWSTQRILLSADRALVRQVIHLAQQLPSPPVLEKVKAHDDRALALQHPKAVGNDAADRWAKRAATEADHPTWPELSAPYDDPVIAVDASGLPVLDLRRQLAVIWWDRRHRSMAQARPLLDRLYPRDVMVDWGPSCGIFRRPIVQKDVFVHPAPPAVIKWLARVRTGCLATRMRLVRHGMVHGSATCRCCGEADEDEEHLLTGCSATGAADWHTSLLEVWRAVARGLQVTVPDPPDSWLEDHRFMLLAALLPIHLAVDCGIPQMVASRFVARLHSALAAATAERLRRRGELLAQAEETSASSSQPSSAPRPQTSQLEGPLPPERRLTVRDIREVEAARRMTTLAAGSATPTVEPRVPTSGDARRRWLRQRLLVVIRENMAECPPAQGVESVVVLELFERVTGEAFSDTPGVAVGQRVRGIAKVLGNISREEDLTPALVSTSHVCHRGKMQLWNRRPREEVDVRAWRRQVEASEARALPMPRLRNQMASADAGLAAWLHDHRYLVATDVPSGESGMALLILWEVDHQRPFPSQGGQGLSATLGSFTKRLQARAAKDPRLTWLQSEDMSTPLSVGLAPTYHKRWSVRLQAPSAGEPRGWYDDFLARWRAYIETLVCSPGSRPTTEVTAEQLARVRPALSTTTAAAVAATPRPAEAVMPGSTSSSPVAPLRAPPRRRVKPPAVAVPVAVPQSTPPDCRPLNSQHSEAPPSAAGEAATSSSTGIAMVDPSPSGPVAASRTAPRRRAQRPAVAVPVAVPQSTPPDCRSLSLQHPKEPPCRRVKPPAVAAPAARTKSPVVDCRRLEQRQPDGQPPPAASQSPQLPLEQHPPVPRVIRRRDEAVDPAPVAKRQRTLLSWARPASLVRPEQRAESSAPRHGRAVEGPPT